MDPLYDAFRRSLYAGFAMCMSVVARIFFDRFLAMLAAFIPGHLTSVRGTDSTASQLFHLGHVLHRTHGFQGFKLLLANNHNLDRLTANIDAVSHATSEDVTRRTRTAVQVVQRLARAHDETVVGRHEDDPLVVVLDSRIAFTQILHAVRPRNLLQRTTRSI